MKVSGATDKGCKRKNNEDFYFIDKERKLFIVADGMGGHQAGERASQLAVETAEKYLSSEIINEAINDDTKIKDAIIEAILKANETVHKESRSSRKLRGMGCTIVVALAKDNLFYICHVGDARAYLVYDNEISLLTEDHTIVQDLINRGNITPEEAKNHPLKSMLSRSIGNKEAVEVESKKILAKPGNYLLLCSDGLNSMVDDEVIKEVVLTEKNTENIKDVLIKKAKEAGGKDNITVVAINIEKEADGGGKGLYKTRRLKDLYDDWSKNNKDLLDVDNDDDEEKPWWKFW